MSDAGTGCYSGRLADHEGRFFSILNTTGRTQVATMTIAPGQEAGAPETHEEADQVFLILKGHALLRTWGSSGGRPHEQVAGPGDVIVVPAGVRHWVGSTGEEPLFFFTVYGPPEY